MNRLQLERRISRLEKLINKRKCINEGVSLTTRECDKLSDDISYFLAKNDVVDVDIDVDDIHDAYGIIHITIYYQGDFVTYNVFVNEYDNIEVSYDIGVDANHPKVLGTFKSLRECAKKIADNFILL